jgi:hypothetical protein
VTTIATFERNRYFNANINLSVAAVRVPGDMIGGESLCGGY